MLYVQEYEIFSRSFESEIHKPPRTTKFCDLMALYIRIIPLISVVSALEMKTMCM